MAPFKRDETDHKPEKLFKALSRGFSFLRGKYDILTLGLTTILSDVAIWGALSILTITISKEIFNKGTWGYGLMDGLYGIGALISTVLIGHLVLKFGRSQSLLLCYGVAGIMCFITPVMPSIYLAATAYFFMGLNNNSARIIIRTLFMENIPNQIMGRVQTIFGVYTRMMVISSALIAGWIIENQSIISGMSFATLHYVAALLGTLAVLNVWKSPKNILAEAN